MRTCVLLPAHNEEAVIGKMVTMLLRLFPEWVTSVIVVNDNSIDGTQRIINALRKKDKRIILINRTGKPGVGYAIMEGIAAVPQDSTHILSMDADFIRNISDLFEFFERIGTHDGLIGSRYVAPHSLVRYPLVKKNL